MQSKRYENLDVRNNAELQGKLIQEYALPTSEAKQMLNDAAEKLKLSMRGYNRVLKLARTIADLQEEDQITKLHISEAISYRRQQYI